MRFVVFWLLLCAIGCGQSAAPEKMDLVGAGGASGGIGGAVATPAGGGGAVSVAGSAGRAGERDAGLAGASADAGLGGTAGSVTDAGDSAGRADASGGEGGALDGARGFCPPKGTPCKIMPLGDSITFGYGSTTGGGYRVELFSLALQAGHEITFVGSQTSGPTSIASTPFPRGNEGHSGYSIDDSTKTSGISPLVEQALARYEPNIVLLMIGTNDMHYSLDLTNAPERLGKLIDQITNDAPDALVVIAKIPPANGLKTLRHVLTTPQSTASSHRASMPANTWRSSTCTRRLRLGRPRASKTPSTPMTRVMRSLRELGMRRSRASCVRSAVANRAAETQLDPEMP